MSRLIDELRATDYPDKSARDLTLEYGQYLESNQRGDIFLANPDFAQEYHALKDEIDRAKRPGYIDEFTGAFGSAVHELASSGLALGALAAHGAKAVGVPGAEPVRDNLLKLMKSQDEAAAENRPSVPSYENISAEHPIEDTTRYLTAGLGMVAPSMIQAAGAGVAGAAVGALAGTGVEPGGGTVAGVVGGALMGLAEKKLAQKALSKLLEKGVTTLTLEQITAALPKEAVAAEAKRIAVEYGAQAALAASSIGQEVGSIYGDRLDAPGTAIAFGIPAGLLDVLPESYVLSRFFKPGAAVADAAAKDAVGYFRRFAQEAFKTVPMEGTTEAMQTLLEIAAQKHADGQSATSFTDADYKQALNAGIIGAIGGLAMAPVAAKSNPAAHVDPTGRIDETVVNRLPIGNAPEGAGPLDFGPGSEIPDSDLGRRYARPREDALSGIGESVIPDAKFDPFQTARPAYQSAQVFQANTDLGPVPGLGLYDDAERGGSRGVLPEADGVTAPPSPPPLNLPSSVAKTVARAAELTSRWEGVDIQADQMAAPEPVPPSAEITDAPLANLIGTQVEYQGYRGQLVRDEVGNFMVMPQVREDSKPFWIEVAATAKNPDTMASAVAVKPLEPANMTPKPAPAITGGMPAITSRPASEISKVPLGNLFPSDLAPRPGLNPIVSEQPGAVLEAQNYRVAPSAAPATLSVAQAPAAPAAPAPLITAPAPAAPPSITAAQLKPIPPDTKFLYEQGGNRYFQIPDAAAARGSRTVDIQTLTKEGYDTRGLPAPVVAAPSGEQVAAASGNGVPALPSDTAPNLRRLRIFEQPKAAPVTEDELGPLPDNARAKPTVEAQAVQENPLVALDKAVGKLGKAESNVAALIVDNATGQAYIRGAYRGSDNTLYVDQSSSRKGTAVGKGSTVSAEADFLKGTEGRPAQKLFAEKTAAGMPRYSVYGVGELTKAGGPRNWNAGPVANLAQHPAIQEAARKFWTDEASKRPTGKSKMPAATTDIEAFPEQMAAWRRENAGAKNLAAMTARIQEYAEAQNKAFGGVMKPEKIGAWVKNLAGTIETIAAIEQKQTVLLSADYTVAPPATIELMRSTIQALTEGRNVDVAAFTQGIQGALDSAAATTGVVISPEGRNKIVAFALGSVNGPVNADTVLSLLHETAHVITDGLAEPLRIAFQEAVETMPWQDQRWLMNPRSLDIRILANAEPEQLSPEQRRALERLTPEEVAAARRMSRSDLLEEQMAEHLAQLGWDRSEAKGVVQRFIRFLKELWLKTALAIQTAIKGPQAVSPSLARAYVENRYLQFINRDAAYGRDRINDLMNWLGAPPTERQLIPVFPAGTDWDQRMQYVDVATGQLIPVDHSTFTPDAQTAYLKTAIDNAARFIREHPNADDTPDFRLTKRAAFSAPLSFTPTLQTNTVFAALNLEAEIYAQIAARSDIAPFLPGGTDFYGEWLRLPDRQLPSARKGEAETWAKSNKDPLTGAPIAYNADIVIDGLPAADEPIVDREGNPITIKLTEAQDKALQQTIASLNDTQSRVQRRINRDIERVADLEKIRKKNPAEFPAPALKELDELNEAIPLRIKIADQLTRQKNALLAKFQPGDLVSIYPTAEYLTVPSPTASESAIRKSARGVVPRDLKFTDKTTFSGHLAAMEAWLTNPDNRNKGQIYGVISEQYRKLMQIPTDLERAGTAGIFRRAITGSFVDELRASGLPGLQNLAKKFFESSSITNAHNDDFKVMGDHWDTAFADFAHAVGSVPDQSFKERVWDPLMRTWNFIDVSERNRIGTPEEGDLFSTMEKSLKNTAGIEVDTAPKRAALRALLMQTIENERQIRTVYEQNAGLKVRDEEMGVHRRLVSHGIVTGRRSVARHMSGLFMQMNPAWSDTSPVGPDDVRTFWEAAGDLYNDDRATLDKKVAELFPGYMLNDFVEPIVNNNTQIFSVTDADGVPRKASLLRVRQAWSEAGGDIIRFAERLHALEGGKPGSEGNTVGNVLTGFQRMFNEIKSDQDSKNGTEALGHEILPRQMMDARIANDWPAEWVSYATYNKADNLTLLHQLALGAAFGSDAIAATGELSSTIREAKRDLDDLYYRYDQAFRDGKSPKEIETLMGKDDYAIAKNAIKISTNLDRVQQAFRSMSSNTNYLAGDFKLFNEALGFASTMMIQNPRGTMINTADILGSLVALKVSTPALKAQARAIQTLAADLGNGVLQAFGQNAAFNTNLALRRMKAGVKDPDLRTTWRQKMNNNGPGLSLAAPSGYETPMAKVSRLATRALVRGRDIIPNLGSPLQGTSEMQTLSPKLRWGGFPNWAMSTMNANIDSAYEVFSDLAERGVDYLKKIPLAERAQFVRELELGVRDLNSDQLGYFGGIILNDKAAFDSMQSAIETKMAGESSVGRFVAKAYRRFETAGDAKWDTISNSQFTDIINYANTEWTLQNNFASLPPWMQSGPLRPMFIFLTWPYNAMRRFGKTFTDADGRLIWWGANSTVADGMKAFFLLAAPATIAGSFAIDWYDKYILGKKQNLRDTSALTAVPVVGAITDPAAFVERVGRYGSAGFASDIINQIVNFDTQRNLSLDNRIVAINAISTLLTSGITTPIHQGGNLTYASVGRPILQAIGGGGVLQYLQILNNALDLNTQDAAINSRINTGNYLRAAGRELNLPVRVTTGAAELPTRATPYLQQMELAALVNNQELFRTAYRSAVDAARDDGRDNPERYVADNFTDRHPLKRLFKTSPTEGEYRKMLGEMDPYGAGQVRGAINSYNRYLTNWFGKKSYYGKADKNGQSVEELIRAATKINTDSSSLLAIP